MKKMDLYLNILIIILEILGLVFSIYYLGKTVFIYYTQLSNLLLLISSILYLVYYYEKKISKRVVGLIKYGDTLSVLITFLVVLFILLPTSSFNYKFLYFGGPNFLYHFLCPVLGVVTFLWYDDIEVDGFKDVFHSMIFTLIYAVVFLFLNIFKVLEGPYFFLMVRKNSLLVSIFWFAFILGGAALFSWLLQRCKSLISKL